MVMRMTALIMMIFIYINYDEVCVCNKKSSLPSNARLALPSVAGFGRAMMIRLPNDGENYDDDVINFVSAHRFQLQRLPRCPISH